MFGLNYKRKGNIYEKKFKSIWSYFRNNSYFRSYIFIVDYNRVQKQEKPIFCIENPAGEISDGGTIEYFGLGYKVIDFHTLAGFDDIKIGTWFMTYNDFEEEIKNIKKTII